MEVQTRKVCSDPKGACQIQSEKQTSDEENINIRCSHTKRWRKGGKGESGKKNEEVTGIERFVESEKNRRKGLEHLAT